MTKARPGPGPAPEAASLRAMPEIDFARFEIRRNRFARRVKQAGIELVHEAPTAASLAEIPEVDLSAPARRRRPATAVPTLVVRPPRTRRPAR